jgi:peroxiredoxin Q/BCP
MAQGPQLGAPAPDFQLEGTEGPFALSEQRGRRIVLLFYPGDETPVCTKQFCSYRDRDDDMSALDAAVVGISSQGLASHESFAAAHGLNVPLLADVDRVVARLYGVDRRLLGTQRATFIVDEAGILRFKKLHTLGLDFLSVDQIREALTGLSAAHA